MMTRSPILIRGLILAATLSLPGVAAATVELTGLSPQGVPYASGGAGEEERQALKDLTRDYNLRLIFAEKSGAYLSEVAVSIASARGSATVFELTDSGPTLLVKLPAGRYRLNASHQGVVKTASLTIPAKGAAARTVYWP